MSNGVNVLSLFDGISCGQQALERCGIKVDNYFASEIDKNAIKVTQHNYPNTIQLGSVTEWQTWKIDFSTIDFIAAGSPCQGFSFAGKQLAFDDPRSKLFFVFVDILHHVQKVNPKVIFLLENVYMKEEHEKVISDMLGVNAIKINSSLLSAQSRKRNYWVNFGMQPMGLFGDLHSIIPQPKDKGIMLRDILQPESEVDEKYYLSEKAVENIITHRDNQKGKGFGFGAKFHEENEKMQCLKVGGRGVDDLVKISKDGSIKSNQEKVDCFTAGGHSGGNHSDMDLICIAQRGRNPDNTSSRKSGEKLTQTIEPRTDGKTNTITSVQKDNMVLQIGNHSTGIITNEGKEKHPCLRANARGQLKGIGIKLKIKEATTKGFTEIAPGECFDFENPDSATRRGCKMEDKANCLMATSSTNLMNYTPNYRIRRLTVKEVCRLQTINDNYFFKDGKQIVSDSAIYRAVGNGWTVDVISYLLNFLHA